MAAFAQFASDLDASTKQLLDRGARLVEILKQGQYVPMDVEKQVAIIFAASKGYLDKIPLDKVIDYESGLFDYLEANNKDDLKSIKTEGSISDEMSESLEKSIKDFTKGFSA